MNNDVRVKICGITRAEDAIAAVTAGADALGFVFYPRSPRNVSLTQARELVASVPAFTTVVGLFVDPDPEFVDEVLQTVPLDVLQFHGDETPSFCEQFKRRYIKAIRVQHTAQVVAAFSAWSGASAILVDTYVAGVAGGTGEAFNWALLPAERPLSLVLAGGLNSANVARAVREVRPYAVDVSGGVESMPGIKDAARIQSFIHEVRCGNANHAGHAR